MTTDDTQELDVNQLKDDLRTLWINLFDICRTHVTLIKVSLQLLSYVRAILNFESAYLLPIYSNTSCNPRNNQITQIIKLSIVTASTATRTPGDTDRISQDTMRN